MPVKFIWDFSNLKSYIELKVLIPNGMNLYNYAFWYVFLTEILELHTLVCLSIGVLFYFIKYLGIHLNS